MPCPRIRIRLRTLLALVACLALGLWAWVTYLSPFHLWHRTIRSDNESIDRREAARRGIAGQVSGVDRDEAISALCRALYDASPRVRETAASTLEDAGPSARSAVPHLVRAMKDSDFTVRWKAAESLGMIVVAGDDKARAMAAPALLGALEDRSPNVRIAAAFSLALMDCGEPAVPVMEAAIREGRDISGTAQLGLGLCGSREEVAVEALTMAARGSYYAQIRQASIAALNRLAASKQRSDR